MSILGGINGFVEDQNDYLLLIFTNEEIAQDDRFSVWSEDFDDIWAIPGFSEGIRLVADPDQRKGQMPRWMYMVAYGFSGNSIHLDETVRRHVMKGDSELWFCKALAEIEKKPWQKQDIEEHVFMALTNPKPGREHDFHEWYNKEHVPDVVSVSCYRSGRRFRISTTEGNILPWRYLAFYRFVGRVSDMHNMLKEDMEKGATKMTDALAEGDGAWIYSAI